jgi:hypothetical protein
MALADFVLKARVNVALIRDPRVGSLDVGVHVKDGDVTLTGDVDGVDECRAAEEVARSVDGVKNVTNEITCGVGMRADTTELLTQRLLEKLEDEWNNLPVKDALAQADYLRWALWLIYKFRLPAEVLEDANGSAVNEEREAVEQAIIQVAGYIGAPKALVALEMLELADHVHSTPRLDAPEISNAPLVATAEVDERQAVGTNQ